MSADEHSPDDEPIIEENRDEPEELTLSSGAESPGLAEEKQGLMRWDEALTLEGQVEAILFAAPKPISVSEICDILQDEEANPADANLIESIVQNLSRLFRERNGGFRLEHDKGVGYQFRTVPAAAPIMEKMFSAKQRSLSSAALQTLAIIAYRQPVTRADIEFIRGVDAGSIIKNLLERDLIACVGRREDAGRPMMFGTSVEFLRVFRLQTLNDLPPISAFQPSPDMLSEANQMIEDADEAIEVEGFIGDETEEMPELSAGLENLDPSADFTQSDEAFAVRETVQRAERPQDMRRMGGSYDDEGFLGDRDENTEVAIPDGGSVETGSGEDADGGPDQHQRQGRPRTRDEDPA